MRPVLLIPLFLMTWQQPAGAAPPELYNKTISAGWTASAAVRDPGGRERQVTSQVRYVVYVSTAGRLFERSSRVAGRQGGLNEAAPGAGSTKVGEARGLAFQGRSLVITRGYGGAGGSGAMRAVVSFGPSFSSCSVSVMHGKENGGILKRRGFDGVVREITSISVGDTTCSVQSGNAFADWPGLRAFPRACCYKEGARALTILSRIVNASRVPSASPFSKSSPD